MANRTDSNADTVHGTNPQYLVDKIVRLKIYNDAYWKEHCFALTTETLIDRVAELDYVGGTYGGRRRPAKFLCLLLKLLQIQPEDDVIHEYMAQSDLKYLRALGCIYFRMTARTPAKVFNVLEPLYADYRKLRFRDMTGKLSIIHMDEFIDWLMREETVCDVTLPQLPKREVLELSNMLEKRVSVLEDEIDELEELEEQARAEIAQAAEDRDTSGRALSPAPAEDARKESVSPGRRAPSRSLTGERSPARSRSKSRRSRSARRQRDRETRGRDREPDRDRDKERNREREMDRDRERDRDKEPDRDRDKERNRRRSRSKSRVRSRSQRRARSQSGSRPQRRGRSEKKEKRDKKEQKEKTDKRPEEPAKEAERTEEPKEKEKKEKKEKKGGKLWGSKAKAMGHHEVASDEKAVVKAKKRDDEMTVEEWNDIRKGLGLKPLAGK